MKNIFWICIITLSTSLQAQDFRFGKVSTEDFEKFSKPQDSSDNAAVIYKNYDVKFSYFQGKGFIQTIDVHERIIIYNKDGADWATKKVRLYDYTSVNSERITSLKGYTYNLLDGKVREDKLRNESVFDEKVNKYWKLKSFTMPNIQAGSIIEYQYQISSPFYKIDDIELQYSIPIHNLEVSIKTPEYFVYNKLLNPQAQFFPKVIDQVNNRTITLNNKEREGFYTNKTTFSQSKIDYKENEIKSSLIDVPALKNEPMVGNLNNYKAKLSMELTMVKFPDQPTENYSTSWEQVTKTIYDDEDFGSQLNKSGYYEDDLQLLLSKSQDKNEQASLIYEFVKSKVKWNGFVGYLTDKGVKKSYNEGSGNVADINLMLVSMLRKAGFTANPVLVSTKSNGIPLFPTRDGFNYVICFIEDQNSQALLDATEQFSTFNIIPFRTQNWQGRVIREDQSSTWISLENNIVSSEVAYLNINIDSNLSINGSFRSQLTNYSAYEFRNAFAGMVDEDHIKHLEKGNGDLIVENLSIKNEKDALKPIIQSYDFELNSALEQIGDKIYFNPMIFLADKENPFNQTKRVLPIDISYPYSKKYMINISFPEDFKLESVPESIGFEYNSGSGKFTYMIKASSSHTIQLMVSLDFLMNVVVPEEYQIFKDFYSEIINKESEQVVLVKA